MLADANAFHLEITVLFSYGDQAEIGGASTDVADQYDVASTHLLAPAIAGLGCPGIKRGLWLFEQDHFSEASCFRGSGRQISSNFIEECRNSQNDLPFGQIPGAGLDGF